MNNAKIGYARVSTEEQNLDLQMDALRSAGCIQIYSEKISGKIAGLERDEFKMCMRSLRPGDTLVVWRLDRLGRSIPDLIKTVTDLEKNKISFESLSERIDTIGATGKLIFHIFACLAQFERDMISERTRAGLTAARARGRVGGRKNALSEQGIREIQVLLSDPTIRVTEISKRYGVSRTTIYKYCHRVIKEVKMNALMQSLHDAMV